MKRPPGKLQGQSRSENQAAYAESAARALVAVLRLQTLVAVVLALALLLIGPVAAYSSVCGSLAVYVPSLLFTMLVGSKIGTSSMVFLRMAALAEFSKLLLTGLLCALAFIWVKPLTPIWFFAGMLTALVAGWIGLAKTIR